MTQSTLRVTELDSERLADWDKFVETCSEATFFHKVGWKNVIEDSFGHRTYFLYAERNGAIEGILPLAHIKSMVFGNSLVSLSFCVNAGPIALNAEALQALDDAARALAAKLNVDQLEYRQAKPGSFDKAVLVDDFYFTFLKSIDPDIEKNMLAIPRKQRAMVRKGQKLGLSSEIDADCKRLHAVYAESVRNLGTPVFGRRYFENLKQEFGEDCEILIVTHEGKPISGVMSFYFRDEVLPYYGGGGARARELAANDFMYWEVMRRACEKGARIFDFGRSKRGTGAFDFKKNWGFEPQALHYHHIMRRGEKPAQINPLNPKLQPFIKIWRRLPLPVANVIGPHIVRYLG